jgi:DNA-binding NtrC family response regulator
MVDQGSGKFEGQKVLAQAMEVDVGLRVLVLARSYNLGCYLEAMRSGALDYLEGPLGAADIVALLDTFMPRRTGGHAALPDRFKGARASKGRMIKVKSN